ncbi:MAG TPA: NADH-quinone oxidoreductase subunit NuoK [Anaerolineae bacterium]|nr:NADH-quinone oxidoreductase subunit NuoK [Anaerolineae bacterium]MCB0226779.1 NADH-quinone oxidoreductase subunit NuoK [Anaerolineae bacterium]HRV96327.1 NADH-quinone oxidoreductase subunit NuoK [Anaerolineae bacterium]
MIGQVPLSYYLLLSAILFAIGAGGVLIRRNVIIVLMCVEMMMNAVNLTFIAFSRYLDSTTGQIFVFMIMAVAAVEVAVGLALLVELNRHKASVNINDFNSLKG